MEWESRVAAARRSLEHGDGPAAWRRLEPLLKACFSDHAAAHIVVEFHRLLQQPGARTPGPCAPDLEALGRHWVTDAGLVIAVVDAMLAPLRHLGPTHRVDEDGTPAAAAALAREALEHLTEARRHEPGVAGRLWFLLGQAHRVAGPRHDGEAESALLKALTLTRAPEVRAELATLHANRGRFHEAARAFRELVDEGHDDTGMLWRLGVAATGAGDGGLAGRAWRALDLGDDGELGGDRLPFVAGLGVVRVRVTTAGFMNPYGPRESEVVWVQPQSPCHGEILSPTRLELPVDVGDIILWDPTVSSLGDDGQSLPPAIGRLERGELRTYPFRAELPGGLELEDLEAALPEDLRLCPFSESGPPEGRPPRGRPLRTIEGKLVVWPEANRRELPTQLTDAMTQFPGALLDVAGLVRAGGDDDGARPTRRSDDAATADLR